MQTAEITISSTPTTSEAPVVAAPQRPDNVPEQFWDAEKGEVNTDALLTHVTAQNAVTPESAETPTETPTETPVEDEQAEALAKEAGVDVSAIEDQWLADKTIPQAELDKLAKVGVTKEMAEEFISYRESQAERIRSELTGTVGGEEAVHKMVEWAGKTYSEEQAASFNTMVNSKDRGQIEMALKALKADYEKANGRAPKLLNPAVKPASTGERYASLAEMLRDQANPLYHKDSAFRQKVMDKLARSPEIL